MQSQLIFMEVVVKTKQDSATNTGDSLGPIKRPFKYVQCRPTTAL